MIIVTIVFSILYLTLLTYVIFSYNETRKMIEDSDERILQLEKRLEYYRSDMFAIKKELDKGIHCKTEDIDSLQCRVEKLERKRKSISKNS